MRVLVAAASLVLLASTVQALPIDPDVTYELGNHPDGNAAPPLYGLRLDGLLTGDTNEIYTFDFDAASSSMTMLWSSSTGQLTISGNVSGGQDAGGTGEYVSGTTSDWAINFVYDDVTACGDHLCANLGSGTIASSIFGSFDLLSVGSSSYGYDFKLMFDHRGFSGLSGFGWLNHCPSAGNSTAGASCSEHVYASDWLFTASAVPEPATLLLMALGLMAVGFAQRRVA